MPPGGADVARPQIRRPLGSLLWDDAADRGARQRAAPAGASGGGGYTKEEIQVLRCVLWRVLLLIMIFSNKAKRIAGHLCVNVGICILSHTSPLKKMHMTVILSYQTCIYFYVHEVAMQKNTRSLGAMIMT